MPDDLAQAACSPEQEKDAGPGQRALYSLARFTMKDMTDCGAALRRLGQGASSLEDLAGRITTYLYDSLADHETGERECVLVRLFMTRDYRDLAPELRRCADDVLGAAPPPDTKCLTLLGTAGERPEWNAAEETGRYRVVPLTSELVVSQLPMVSQLLRQFGVKLKGGDSLSSSLLMDGDEIDYKVFYISDAVGSPFVPAQDEFVGKLGIRSVLGFGGLLPSGDLFAVILFSKTPVSREAADLFRALALSVKLAMLPVSTRVTGTSYHESYVKTMNQLLTVQEWAVGIQSERLTLLLDKLRMYTSGLEQSHGQLQSFVANTPAAVAMFDRDLNYMAVSKRWVQDYRLEDRTLIGRHHYDVFPEIRLREDWQEIHRRCLEGTIERREEDRLLRADGSEDWLRWEIHPWYTDAGGIGGIMIFSEVITERKRTELALRESQERFSKAFNEAAIGMALVAPDGRWLEVNRALCEIIGYSAVELRNSNFQAITHPDDLEADVTLVHRLLRGEIPNYQMEKRYIHKQGHVVWILLSVSLVHDSLGTPLYFISEIQDITERKRAEVALRESEALLQEVLKALPVGVWIQEASGRIVQGNPAGQAIWGGARYVGIEEFGEYKGWWAETGAPISTEEWAGARAIRNGETSLDEEIVIQSFDGARKVILNSAIPIFDAGQQIKGAIIVNQDITERKRTEETTRRLVAILEATSDFVGTADSEEHALYVNEAGCRMTGVRLSEASTMAVSDFHPEWAAAMVAQEGIPAAIRNGVWTGETAVLHRDGREIPVSQVIIAHKNSAGQVEFLSTIMRDISERKKSEQALRRSEAQLQAILDNSPSLIFTKDPEGRYLRVNKRFAHVFQMTPQEIVGRTDAELFPPEQAAAFRENDRQVLQTGRTMEFEETALYEDGQHVSLVHKFPLFDQQGRIEAVGGIATDITARKRAQEAQARLAALVTSSQDAIVSKTLDSRVTSWNEGAERMFGYSAEEIVGRSVIRLIPPERLLEEPEILRRIKKEERIDQYETVRLRKDGSPIDVSLSFSPIKDEAGRVVGVVQTARDVTERKRAEAVLREREAQLSHMLAEREELSRDLHDNIVQMLVACGLGLESSRSLVKSDARRAVREISHAITELNLVIEDVRHYIVGLDPRIRLSTKRFRMELHRVIQALQGVESPEFRVRLSDAAVRRLTPDQAKHLLLIAREAISNSVRHGQASTITLSLSRHRRGVRLAVKDNGKGFNVSRSRNEGYGIRNIAMRAKRIKARFQLISKRGKGTQVFVDLSTSESA